MKIKKLNTKLLSVLLALCMVVALIPVTVFAATPVENQVVFFWDDYTPEGGSSAIVRYQIGDGTIENAEMDTPISIDVNKSLTFFYTPGKDSENNPDEFWGIEYFFDGEEPVIVERNDLTENDGTYSYTVDRQDNTKALVVIANRTAPGNDLFIVDDDYTVQTDEQYDEVFVENHTLTIAENQTLTVNGNLGLHNGKLVVNGNLTIGDKLIIDCEDGAVNTVQGIHLHDAEGGGLENVEGVYTFTESCNFGFDAGRDMWVHTIDTARGDYEGEPETSDVTLTINDSNSSRADFFINDSNMMNLYSGNETGTLTYSYDNGENVDFYFNTHIFERITSLKINDVDYTGSLPNPNVEGGIAGLLAACRHQSNEFMITVPYSSEGYTIECERKYLDDSSEDAPYWVLGNFLWSYAEGDIEQTNYGTMEFVDIQYDGRTFFENGVGDSGIYEDWIPIYYEQGEGAIGAAVLPVGAVVTLRLVPNVGYQVTALNGVPSECIDTDGDESIFSFTVEPGNKHLSAQFSAVDDVVNSVTEGVSGGTIMLGDGENAIVNGTARLDVADAELNDEQMANFENAAGDYEIQHYFDISLFQTIYKGSADDSWDTQIDDLSETATITLELAEGVDGNAVVILHETHDGTYEQIPAEYDEDTRTVTFQTSSFSNYAIATKSDVLSEIYDIVKGQDQEVPANKDASFTSNAEFDKFVKVQVDGKDVDAKYYTVEEGSTIVTLKSEFLRTLTSGIHTISIVSEDGVANSNFTVGAATVLSDDTPAQPGKTDKPAQSEKTDKIASPKTGDTSKIFLWVALIFVSSIGVVATTMLGKKRRYNR